MTLAHVRGDAILGSVEFRVLGGLVVLANGRPLALGTPKQRTLASLLVMRTNAVVPVHEIIEELWGMSAPKSAMANLRTYAARVRAALPLSERHRLVVQSSGYRLSVQAKELDLCVFEDGVERGRAALQRNDAEEALRWLEAGLSLWRGRLLEDVPHGPVIGAREVAITARRLSAEEDRCAALLMSGRAASAAAILRSLVTDHTLRERAWELLMYALYADQDMEGALDAYLRARAAMTEALGIEPAERLRRLHLAILRQELPQPRAAAQIRTTAPSPRQLPPAPAVVGRSAELRILTDHLVDPGNLVVVHGPAGSGKSALALHAAHLVADRYRDGQLYLDLRSDSRRDDHLQLVLEGLGVNMTDPGAARAHYRSLLADRRMLVVLDNTTGSAQVRHLLPAAPRCTVLVTSCSMHATLDRAWHLRVRELSELDSLALLSLYADPEQFGADRGAAAELARLCDRLPLALRIVAARLMTRSDRPIREMVWLLSNEDHRLDELEADDLSVIASLRRPYDALKASQRPVDSLAVQVFERLGRLRVPSVQPTDIARGHGAPVVQVGRALDRLVEVELLGLDQRAQYRVSDLNRLLSRKVAGTPQSQPAWLMPSA